MRYEKRNQNIIILSMFSMQIFAHMLILFSSLRGKNCISFIYVNIYLLFNTTEFSFNLFRSHGGKHRENCRCARKVWRHQLKFSTKFLYRLPRFVNIWNMAKAKNFYWNIIWKYYPHYFHFDPIYITYHTMYWSGQSWSSG